MTSTSIYTSEKVLPYVYRLDNPITGEFYIGYRMANKIPSHLDLPKYRTSAPEIKKNFNNFIWKILAEFTNGNDAYDHEQLSIFEEWGNPLLLNQTCRYGSSKRFKCSDIRTPEHNAKIGAANKGNVMSKETNEKNSAARKGTMCAVDNDGNFSRISVDDQRFISGELSGNRKGSTNPGLNKRKVAAKFVISGIGIQVNIDDPRLKTGELVGVTKGNKYKVNKLQCPHCDKIGKDAPMKRWHFDNCKYNLQSPFKC
jgi:hypothetical protein